MILIFAFFIILNIMTSKTAEINGIFKVDYFDSSGFHYVGKNLTENLLWIRLRSITDYKKSFWLKIKRKNQNEYPVLVKSMTRDSYNLPTPPQYSDCHFHTASHLVTHREHTHTRREDFPLVKKDTHAQGYQSLASYRPDELPLADFHSQDSPPFVEGVVKDNDITDDLPISVCHGLSGIVSLPGGQKLVRIEPSSHDRLDMVRVTEISKLEPNNLHLLGGFHQLKNAAKTVVRKRLQRVKRSFNMPVHSMPGPFLVELYLVVDSKMASMYNENHYQKLLSRIRSIMNQINVAFMQFNIYFTVVQLEIWEYDQIKLTDENHILMELQLYKRQFALKRHDCLHAILGENLGSSRRGQSEPAAMCAFNRCVGYTKDYWGLSELEIAHSVMHEIGHNFGLSHDTEKCQCFGCIMATGVEFGSLKFQWSNCSRKQISGLLMSGMADCLRDRPTSDLGDFEPVIMSSNKVSKKLSLMTLSKCGNGVVDEGEQCDCGGSMCSAEAKRCCQPDTCRLRFMAHCASGACCDLTTCSIKSAGTICRSLDLKDCDLPEYCDGSNEWCPADVYKHDGIPCKTTGVGDWSHCYHGECQSRKSWCKVLYGDTGNEASSRCYDMNKYGSDVKNCGLDIPVKEDRYGQPKYWNTRRCQDKDVMCGRLWCSHENERVLRSSPQMEVDEEVQGYHCSAARFYLDWFLDDAGLVPNGSPCGYGKMCWRGVCIHSVYNDMGGCYCHGHGVCNNRRHCHCEAGFAAPNCTDPGNGGSVDSGPLGQYHGKSRIVVASVFIVLVVLLTCLGLGILLYHYNTRRWPSILTKVRIPHYRKPESEMDKSEICKRDDNHYSTRVGGHPIPGQLNLGRGPEYRHPPFSKEPNSDLPSPKSPTPILSDELIYANIPHSTSTSSKSSPPPQKNPNKPSSIKSKALMFEKVAPGTRTVNFQNPQLLQVHPKPKTISQELSKVLSKNPKPSGMVRKPGSPSSKESELSTDPKFFHKGPPLLTSKPGPKPVISKTSKPEVAKKPNHSKGDGPPLILSEKPPPKTKIQTKPDIGSPSKTPLYKEGERVPPAAPETTSHQRLPGTKATKDLISQPTLNQTTCTAKTRDLPSTDQTLSRTVTPHKILKVDPHKAVKYLY